MDSGKVRKITRTEFLDFTRSPNQNTFESLSLRLLELAEAVQAGTCQGGVMTDAAHRCLMMLLDGYEIDTADATSVEFTNALIYIVRVARVEKGKPFLRKIVDHFYGVPISILGQAAAHAAWVMGDRRRALDPFIAEILLDKMSDESRKPYCVTF